MNRPSEKYTYLADKHYESNYKILYAFSKEVIRELAINPDGVQLPFFHIKLIRKKCISNSYFLKQKYGKNAEYKNSHTDGEVITTRVEWKTRLTNKKPFWAWANIFKFEPYRPLKDKQYEVSHNNYYDFDKA